MKSSMFTAGFIERFKARVSVQENGCWIWCGYKQTTGYGQVGFKGQRLLTHRISYALHFGEAPSDLFVLHRCDNRPCVNPNHLFLGTHQDNTDDMVAKGRQDKRRDFSKCLNGHEMSPGDWLSWKDKRAVTGTVRVCKHCEKERKARSYKRRKAALAA